MKDFLKQFKYIKSEYDDGSGFWDEYNKKDEWLDRIIEISIAIRNMSDYIPSLLQNFMDNQSYWDKNFKEFASKNLLSSLKIEWDSPLLTVEEVIEKIEISSIAFGYESNEAFCIWFSTNSEHGIQVYGDTQGNLTRTSIE